MKDKKKCIQYNCLKSTDIRRSSNANLNLSEDYQFLHSKESNSLVIARNKLINRLKKENDVLALENVKLLDEIAILKKVIDSN